LKSHIPNKIDGLGRREATTVATATTQRVFATLSGPELPRRKAVNLNNMDLSAEIYVTLAPTGSAAPTVSSSDNDVIVPSRSSRQFQIGPGIELWLRSSSNGAVAYTALELV
jgi:hypothetical protein